MHQTHLPAMRIKVKRFLPLALVAILPSCDIDSKFEKLNKQIDETQELAEKTAKAAVLAVPGERYLQIVDNLNGSDPVKRQAAISFLENLAGKNLQNNFEVTVWLDTDVKDPLEVAIFRSSTPNRSEISHWLQQGYYRPEKLHSSSVPKTHKQRIEALQPRIIKMFDEYSKYKVGPPATYRGDLDQEYTQLRIIPDYSYLPTESFRSNGPIDPAKRKLAAEMAAINAKREKLAMELAEEILSPFAPIEAPAISNTLKKIWLPLDKHQYLIVLIHEDDWLKHKDRNLQIRALVHEVDQPSDSLGKSEPYTFDPLEFAPNRNSPLDNPKPRGGRLLWASINMGLDSSISPEKIKELREVVNELDSLLSNKKN